MRNHIGITLYTGLRSLLLLTLLSLGADAQRREGLPLAAVPDSLLGPLGAPVTIATDTTSLVGVLRDIAAQAGFVIVFDTDLASEQPRPVIRMAAEPARDVLLAALRYTDLEALRLDDGKILLSPRRQVSPTGAAGRGGMPQAAVQTIRGRVVDRDALFALPGANVVVVGSQPLLGATADREGRFVLEKVPLGRHDIRVSFVGYEPLLISGVAVTSSKEVVLEAALTEQVLRGQEIVVAPERNTGQALNDMAAVSARSFTVEETRRFAGGADDPARMAAAFAGVATGAGVQDNAVAVRGNAPRSVQWRLEGVEIPNPSHFAGMTVAGGGGLTLFSGQVLADSDFLTSAFPAEYGNALAGVFDMNFRSGNPSRREHAVQVGVLGIDVASEGPFVEGREATYLFNYRYSTIGLLLPLLPTEDVARYQDLSFKMSFPTRRLGRFDWWGIGGLDGQSMSEEPDSTQWEYDVWDRTRFDLGLGIGATGVSHQLVVGTRSYLKTTAAVTAHHTRLDQQRLDDLAMLRDDLYLNSTTGRFVVGSFLSHKFGARHVNRTGLTIQRLFFDLDLQAALPDPTAATSRSAFLTPLNNDSGTSTLMQAYSQSRITLSTAVAVNTGLHLQHFALTGRTSLEPRASLIVSIGSLGTMTIGYGLHSQIDELRMYFIRDGQDRPNRDLGFTRAHHFVAGYERQLGERARLGFEAYLQSLYGVPVVPGTSTSLLNFDEQDWTFSDRLVNRGAGRNYGIEGTLERSLSDGYYVLVTGSLFRSEYRGDDMVWRPTRFDRRYTVNALFGKEIEMLGGRRVLGLNGRAAMIGGKRRSPVLETASRTREDVVYNELRAFEERESGLFLLDLTATYRVNHARFSQVWALQVKNALAAKDVSLDYNYRTRRVEEIRDGFPLPVLSFRLEF